MGMAFRAHESTLVKAKKGITEASPGPGGGEKKEMKEMKAMKETGGGKEEGVHSTDASYRDVVEASRQVRFQQQRRQQRQQQ